MNFDGKDDIALISDMGASNGPYYTFFIQNDSNKFIKDDFLTDEVMLFPHKIDTLHKQISTAWCTGSGCGFHTYQFDLPANKWRKFRHEWNGRDGNIISLWDSITNKWEEISRKLIEEK